MGAGLAKAFKQQFPLPCEIFNQQSLLFQKKWASPQLMKPVYHKSDSVFDGDGIDILFFPTKIHWRNPSKLEYIEKNMPIALNLLEKNSVPSVAFPFLGCGLGGLDRGDVLKIFEKYETLYTGKLSIYAEFFESNSKRNY